MGKAEIFFFILFCFFIFMYFKWESIKIATGFDKFIKFVVVIIGLLTIACPNLRDIISDKF